MKLETDKYYHIYNCGINGCNLFKDANDYEHFLKLHTKYIENIADTFAWCLMKNHFHYLIRVKSTKEIGNYKYTRQSFKQAILNKTISSNIEFEDVKWNTDTNSIENKNKAPNPTSHFGHLFNSYAKFFNKKYSRHGSLFEQSFKRKEIKNEKYFKQLILYIHNNPVKHGFVESPIEWSWSSYLGYLKDQNEGSAFNSTIKQFGNKQNFIATHNLLPDISQIENMLGVF